MPAVPTLNSTRTGRKSAILAAIQSAKGVPTNDFTGASAMRFFLDSGRADVGRIKNDDGGLSMTTAQSDHVSSRYNRPDAPQDTIRAKLTPQSAEFLLRSNWGPFSGGSFTLSSQVNEWLTLAYIESVIGADLQRAFRLQDTFFHRLTIRALGDPENNEVVAEAEYFARKSFDAEINSDLVLPPMVQGSAAPADRDVFAGRNVELSIVDDALDLRWSELEIVLDQRGRSEFSMTSNLRTVLKSGKARATIGFRGEVNKESMGVLIDARAGTKKQFRVKMTEPVTGKILQFDFFNADFDFESTGPEGLDTVEFQAEAAATVSGSSFVDIGLS